MPCFLGWGGWDLGILFCFICVFNQFSCVQTFPSVTLHILMRCLRCLCSEPFWDSREGIYVFLTDTPPLQALKFPIFPLHTQSYFFCFLSFRKLMMYLFCYLLLFFFILDLCPFCQAYQVGGFQVGAEVNVFSSLMFSRIPSRPFLSLYWKYIFFVFKCVQ